MRQILVTSISDQKSPCQLPKNSRVPLTGQSWTAARCRQLLHPLIYGLEQLKQDSIGSKSLESAPGTHQSPEIPLSDPDHDDLKKRKTCEEDDACWRPASKRIRKTYSSRHKPKGHGFADGCPFPQAPRKIQAQKSALRPGEVLVTTPFLCRAKAVKIDLSREPVLDTSLAEPPETNLDRPSKPSCKGRNLEARFRLAESMRRIRKTTHIARYSVYEGIYNAFDALIRATLPVKDQVAPSFNNRKHDEKSRGPPASDTPRPRSLFSICLRNVPEYIQQEEKWVAADAELRNINSALDEESISAKVYSSLESLGTSGSGWRHLRTVVRAHGVLVIKNAILQHLVDTSFASVLVMLCAHKSAVGEAEKLLTAVITASRYPNPISTSSTFHENPLLQPLLVLEDLTAKTGRVNYYYRQMTELIIQQLLPISWLATKAFGSVWATMFRLLSDDPTNRDAIAFIANILPVICASNPLSASQRGGESVLQDEMSSALYNTLRSLLITFSAMCLLNSAYKRNIVLLSEHIQVDSSTISLEFDHDRLALVAMTQLFAGCGISKNSDVSRPLLEVLCRRSSGFSTSRFVKEDLPAFVCDVAHCLARGTSSKPFEHLKILIGHMEASAATDTSGSRLVLDRIIRGCAFSFAQHQPVQDQEHFKYAQKFARHRQSIGVQPEKPVGIPRSPSDNGFRWEEGICEWVTTTPAPKPGKDRRAFFSDKTRFRCLQNINSNRRKQVSTYPSERRFPGSPRLLHNSVSGLDPPILPCPSISPECTTTPSQQRDAQSAVVRCIQLSSPLQLSLKQPRRRTNKLRRLGKGHLHSGQSWKVFRDSDSDDELSIPNPGMIQKVSRKPLGPGHSINARKRRADRSLKMSSSATSFAGENLDELGL